MSKDRDLELLKDSIIEYLEGNFEDLVITSDESSIDLRSTDGDKFIITVKRER